MWFTVIDVYNAWGEGNCPVDIGDNDRVTYWFDNSEVNAIDAVSGGRFCLTLSDGREVIVNRYDQMYVLPYRFDQEDEIQ